MEALFREWVLDVFINGFCVSLVRPGILIFLGLVLCTRFGAGLGLPLLFWRPREPQPTAGGADPTLGTRPNRPAQFLVGMGVGALIWQVLQAGYLFEELASNFTRDRPPFCEIRPPYEDAPVHDFAGVLGRFRYDPLAWSTMWRYALAVGAGLAVAGAAVATIGFLYRTGAAAYWRRIGWVPFQPAPREYPRGIDPRVIPRSWPAMLGGILCGALILSGLTHALVSPSAEAHAERLGRERNAGAGAPEAQPEPAPPPAERIGLSLTTGAGWGDMQARRTAVDYFARFMKNRRIDAKRESDPTWQPAPDQREHAAQKAEDLRTKKEMALERYGQPDLIPYHPIYGAFVINFCAIALVSVVLMLLPRRLSFFSPAVGIILLLNLLLLVSTLLNYFCPIPADFIFLLVLGLVLTAGRGYKLKFPNLEDYYRTPVPLSALYEQRAVEEANETRADAGPPASSRAEAMGRAEPATGANETRADAGPPVLLNSPDKRVRYPNPLVAPAGRAKPPMAIVCVSGGGSRAAAWTMKVLLEIESHFATPGGGKPPVLFPHHVRLMAGASGGMIAAAQYVASLAEPTESSVARGHVNRNRPFVRPDPAAPGRFSGGDPLTHEQLFDGVCADFLTPIVHTLVSRDLLSLLTPLHLGRTDRGVRLEREWQLALHGQLDQTFADLRPGEAAGWRPSLIFSPMLVEDGRQLFISNLDLSPVVRNRAFILGENGPRSEELNPEHPGDRRRLLSREGLEFFKVFPRADNFRLATAARMSASFPYVLPAAYLPTNPPRRVVDAGYYDNYGVGIAASWLFNHMDWVREHTSGVVVIQIRDGVSGGFRRRERVFDAFPSPVTAGSHWLTSPPTGLWSFRQAAHAFRNDNLLHLLNSHFRAGAGADDPEFFTTVSFELQQGDDVALNFALTEGERNVILNAVTERDFRSQLEALEEWWRARGA